MKYITDGERGFDHGPYWRYLESVEGVMPAHMFEFASNADHHNLTSPNSLHDSWLESWNISEISVGDNRRLRRLDINTCLLGPMHDRYIRLRYKKVERHTITANRWPAYGDLLVHELTIEQDGLYAHELIFAGGAIFSVQFREFEHWIEPFAKLGNE